jgi:cytochrome c nitrite reductase small subunit
MNKLYEVIKKLMPPQGWKLSVVISLGVLAGLSATAFHISNASSYLSDDPRACINCHVMYPQYASWQHSSHRERANCNDCHVPHDNFIRKYYFKAADGRRHATIFTLRMEPQVIRIKEAGKAVVQENCIRCHINQINHVTAVQVTGKNYKEGKGHLCWDCHREVPHGRVSSQASTPNAIVPSLPKPAPDWFMKLIE